MLNVAIFLRYDFDVQERRRSSNRRELDQSTRNSRVAVSSEIVYEGIEIDEHQRLAFDHTQDRNRLLTTLMIQMIRIDDFFARHISYLRRACASQY